MEPWVAESESGDHQISRQGADEEWKAFCEIGDISEIASPRFCRLANLAHAEGLLVPMLAGNLEEVRRRSSELSNALSAQINSSYQIPLATNPMTSTLEFDEFSASVSELLRKHRRS